MKYTKEKLIVAAKDAKSVREVCSNLGITYVSGSIQTLISRRLKEYQIDTSQFLGMGHNKGKPALNRRTANEILICRQSGYRERASRLRDSLLEIGRLYICEECNNNGSWRNKLLILSVHHKDANPLNNKAENLQFLCPNCHSQTDNFSRRCTPKVEGAG